MPEQTPCLGPIMAGEHSFPICPKGLKAPKSSDLRGYSEFKLLTGFQRPCVLVKVKPCRYKQCFESILQLRYKRRGLSKQLTGSRARIIAVFRTRFSSALITNSLLIFHTFEFHVQVVYPQRCRFLIKVLPFRYSL